jgi:acyl dehydratase
MGTLRSYTVGQEIPPLEKQIAQERINLFEASGAHAGPSIFTDRETARKTIGMEGTVASGRVSLSFAVEALRRFFGEDVYNRTGMVDLRFLRPVRDGDSVTVSGKIIGVTREANGQRVTVEVAIQNQNGLTTAAGMGAAIVPVGFLSPSE